MNFTRRTYHRAFKRSLKIEYELFQQPWSIMATHGWYQQMLHTRAIRRRAEREGKW